MIDRKQLAGLRRCSDEVRVAAGETIAHEGSFCHEFLIVVSGELSVESRGEAVILGPGASYGWEAMKERGRHESTVVARTDAHLCVMGHAQFRAAEALGLQERPRAFLLIASDNQVS